MQRVIAAIAVLIMLPACTPSLPGDVATYRDRLANVLDQSPIPLPSAPVLPPLPRIERPADEVKLSLNEFYQLSECALYTLVAERNTTLGRLQAPSARYLYERQLLEALNACERTTREPALKAKLQQWQRIKQGQLGDSWQSLLNSKELRQGLSRNQGWLTREQQDTNSTSLAAWRFLIQLAPSSSQNAEPGRLEQHLKSIAQNHLTSRVIRTQHYLSQSLPELTRWLEQHQPSCNTDSARYLGNVFGRFFIQAIQPVGARLNHYHYQLTPILTDLYLKPDQPKSIRQWLDTHWFEGFQAYQMAMQEHIRWWQGFFSQCDLAPPVPER